MSHKQVSTLGLLVAAGMLGLLCTLAHAREPESGVSDSPGIAIDALPPSGAGRPSSLASAPADASRPEQYLGGTHATGRIAEVYVKAAENVFLALDRAPESLRNSAQRWVDVEIPELLANDTVSTRAVLNRSEARVKVGDIVEIKFAHRDNPRYFPVREVTQVTELVASKDQMLAKEFARRMLAPNGHVALPETWLIPAQTSPSDPPPPPRTTTADARR
jgi:hypothetical protein